MWGLRETDLKKDKKILKHYNKRHTTDLVKYIWNLKDNNTDFKTK